MAGSTLLTTAMVVVMGGMIGGAMWTVRDDAGIETSEAAAHD